jgi:dolichyl-phosphate-mannose--protein O-mannosyl transferase
MILFALSVILVGVSVHTISGSAPFAILGAALLAFSDMHLEIYALALSESLFLVLMLIAYLLLARYLKPESRNWLILAGIVLGLAYLTRYVATSLWVTAVLVLALLGGRSKTHPNRSWLRSILILLGSGLPAVLIWFILATLTSGHCS